MAKAKTNTNVKTHQVKSKPKRPGIHAKTKSSKSKNSKLWTKLNVGQGSKR